MLITLNIYVKKSVSNSQINNKTAWVQVMMVRRRTGGRPLLEPVVTQFTDVYMRTRGGGGG